ncbi:hypothetical protein HDU97_004569 [Phlyctochytrium planicorne]|nr:hypothetical protein HDU97_004569 [Phlyctochytrium planicorne]
MTKTTRMIAKFGNKNVYKGTGSGSMGKWTSKGKFIIEQHKVRQFMVPDLNGFELTPYVDPTFKTKIRATHSVEDYFKPENLPQGLDAGLVENMQRAAAEVYNRMRKIDA